MVYLPTFTLKINETHVKYNIHDVMGGTGIDMKDGINKFEQSLLEGKFQWILVVTPSWNNSHRKHESDVSPFRWNWRCTSALERRSGVPEGIRTSWSWFTTTLQGRKRWRKEQQWGVNTKMAFTVSGPPFCRLLYPSTLRWHKAFSVER